MFSLRFLFHSFYLYRTGVGDRTFRDELSWYFKETRRAEMARNIQPNRCGTIDFNDESAVASRHLLEAMFAVGLCVRRPRSIVNSRNILCISVVGRNFNPPPSFR
jgi:hypothetical protein